MRAQGQADAKEGALTVVTYNMLAKSLGSNCIPWMIEISPALLERIQQATGTAWNKWRLDVLQQGYKKHFHKNVASGDYMAMRAFWSATHCASENDIPEVLRERVSFVREDVVAYSVGRRQPVEATTLRGLLHAALEADLAKAVFDNIVGRDAECFSWAVRGPRVFRQLTGPWADLDGARADVIALQEYDVHDEKAAYRGEGVQETFVEAMAAAGYGCAFFKEPNTKREVPTGIAIYFLRRTCAAEADVPLVELACGESALADGAFNIDLNERYHALDKSGQPGKLVQMPNQDRRCAGLLRLTHGGVPLWVCTAHLMTESRDNAKNCMYPVRLSHALPCLAAGTFCSLPFLHAALTDAGRGARRRAGDHPRGRRQVRRLSRRPAPLRRRLQQRARQPSLHRRDRY
jgi:hypothetical protein